MSTSPEPTTARPSIRITAPEGWFFKESYTVLSPDGKANVIASSEPLDPSLNAYDYARQQSDLISAEFTGLIRRHDLEPYFVEGVKDTAWLSEFSWAPRDSDPVTQIQVYAARPGRGFTATATARTADLEAYRRVLSDVLTSLIVDEEAADEAATAVEQSRHESVSAP
ncbi:hypothetical protein GCM10010492_72470 [Saccharothrix mutabilis subsp. mutabilis]|uniref:DUF1795 domain-containing protein n=1 Tax=Saccharothrix mutabilis subsp. mutabilis TaxID=66855 RepID=A0ABP3EEK5_9PSEU